MADYSQAPARPRNVWTVILLIVAMLVVVGFVHVAVQQNYRLGANDPQIEIAGDLAAEMSAGSLATDALSPRASTIDPRTSLGTFGIITDTQGRVLSTNMKMDNTTPVPPKGVLSASSVEHQDRITWQPEKGVRIALVVQAYKHDANGGYVIVGRSIKEVETRIDMLMWMSLVAAAAVVVLGGLALLMGRAKR